VNRLYSVSILLTILLVTASCAFAQESGAGRISGRVLSQSTGKPLERASISCISKKDSALLSYTFSNAKGEFILEKIPREKKVNVFVSYYGCIDSVATVELKTDQLNTGEWLLQSKSVNLKGIEVTAAKAPFSIRNDTLEFDASVFKLEANAPVAALLKKLPGLMIDNNGTITVNGKTVTKIQVDGRDFFGDNKEATTKYLPADIIDKVQVVPTKTIAQQRSLSVKPPSEDVTLNLTLKKDKKAGVIGNVSAGAGSQQRYNVDGMINSFRDPGRISLLGSVTNTGESPGGAMITMASPGGQAGAGGGLSEQQTGSININTKYGTKLSADVSYNYSGAKNTTEQTIEHLNLIPGNSFSNNSSNAAVSHSKQHQFYTGITYEQDSLTLWTFRPMASFGKTSSSTNSNALSQTTAGKLLNTLVSRAESQNNNINLGNELVFNKTSRNRKFNMNSSWRFGYNHKNSEQQNISFNNFYTDEVITQRDSINQQENERENNYTNNLTLNLSADIGKGFVVALDYILDAVSNEQLKEVFNYDKGGSIDSTLSGHNKNSSFTQTPSAQFAWKSKRLSIALNAGMRFMQQQNRLLWKDSVINIHQQQFSPNLQLNYTFKKGGQIFAGYSVSSSAPSAEQLSPVIDNSNPLFIKKGNPSLKGTFIQNVFTNIFYYDPIHASSMNLNAGLSFSGNQIVSDQRYDSMGRQISTYQNVNGSWTFNVQASVSRRKQWDNWTLSAGLNVGTARSNIIGFVSGQKNSSVDWKSRGGFFGSIEFKKLFTLSPSLSMQVSKTSYSLSGIQPITYNTKSCRMDLQLTPVKRVAFMGDVNYTYNSQQPAIFLCSSSVAYKFLKKEQLVLKYRVNDIFNNNKSISRSTTATYMETREVNALQRYMMISVQYFFGKMGAQQGVIQAVSL
jgi:hypothetical protein